MDHRSAISQFPFEEHKEAQRFYLASFAPSVGVGIYRTFGTSHIFDLVSPVEDHNIDSYAARIHEALSDTNQISIGVGFDRLDQLMGFCRREYLKDKKDTYYSMLFTLRLPKAIATKALHFLNDPRLCEIKVSRIVISVLKQEANPRHVSRAIALAHRLGLENVKQCLGSEFREILIARQVIAAIERLTSDAPSILETFNLSRPANSTADHRSNSKG